MTTQSRGWMVSFEVTGATRADIETAIIAHLSAFDPEGKDDPGRGWQLDVVVAPLAISHGGSIEHWKAEVTAQRVNLAPGGPIE